MALSRSSIADQPTTPDEGVAPAACGCRVQPARAIPSVILGLLMAFFPKCPFCCAAYLSVFGILGVAQIPDLGWLYPLLAALLGIHLLLALRRAPQTGYGPVTLSVAGGLAILLGRHYPPAFSGWISMGGILLLAAGSLWDSLSANRMPASIPH